MHAPAGSPHPTPPHPIPTPGSPLCRAPLPPGPESLFDLGIRTYIKINHMVRRGEASWSALSPKLAKEMRDARTCLQEAADQAHAGAQSALSDLYRFGDGGPRDLGAAVALREAAAAQGHAYAQYNLGCLALEGAGVPQDYVRAIDLFTRSAEQGMRAAQCSLGVMFASGWGVERDFARAIELFELSAAQGHAEAQYNLACSWASGRGHLKQDLSTAREWFAKAAAQAYRPAVIALPQIDAELARTAAKQV